MINKIDKKNIKEIKRNKYETKQTILNKKKQLSDTKEQRQNIYENIEFESVLIKSAFKNYSTTWVVRHKLTEDEERNIIMNGKKASKNKKIPDKDFVKPHHRGIIFYNESDDDNDENDIIITADFSIIIEKTITERHKIYEQELLKLKNIIINENIRCIFRKYNYNDLNWTYATVNLPQSNDNIQCSGKILHASQINKLLVKK